MLVQYSPVHPGLSVGGQLGCSQKAKLEVCSRSGDDDISATSLQWHEHPRDNEGSNRDHFLPNSMHQ
jgi:hypothetical protein